MAAHFRDKAKEPLAYMKCTGMKMAGQQVACPRRARVCSTHSVQKPQVDPEGEAPYLTKSACSPGLPCVTIRPDVNMQPRDLVSSLAAPLVLAALCLAAACGGGGSTANNHTGQLTDPQNVPTATPWQKPPDPVLLDPSNIKPLPPNEPNAGPTDKPAPGEPGVCGQTYTVVAGDTTFGIADKCGVGPQAIIDANPGVNPGALSVGQVLIMPAPATASPTPAATSQ